MKEQAVNTFKGGLVMDLNPMAGDGTTLSNALNATLLTNNGNELMLQNDMGNGRINKVRLDEGYIPVGIKEHGGIIYIASYNPETKKGQIGSFPYPKVEYDASEFINEDTSLDFIYEEDPRTSKSICTGEDLTFYKIANSSQKIKLFITENESGEQVQAKFRQGDSFTLTFSPETSSYLMSDNIEATIVSKTASDYVTLHIISKEELEKGEPISVIYDYPYSGTLFLQISLNIPDTFDISYEYNNGTFTIYPYAYNSEDSENIYTNTADVKVNSEHITNFNCDSFITLSTGTYDIYPVTSDKGYLNYLKQKIILNEDSKNNIFKYTFNDGFLDLYWDILTDSHYNEGTSYRFIYNFYPLESAGNVTSLQALQQLPYTTQVISKDYPVISGLRNLKCTLPSDTIYVLLINVSTKIQDIYSTETPCFWGFVYATPRYNETFKECDNFNTINKEDQEQEINYTFNRQLLELNRTSITNKHLTQEEQWEESQGVILFSDTLIPDNKIPKAYSSEIAVAITKTDEPVVVAPKQDVNFIYDSDQFSVESSKFDINLNNAEVNDVPEKNKSTRIITTLDSNAYKPFKLTQDSITFYRYISSESSDGQAQQTRTFKQLMPVFNPTAAYYDELFGFDFTDMNTVASQDGNTTTTCSTTGVFGSKSYLNMTEPISLMVCNSQEAIGIFDEKLLGCANRLTGDSEGNSSPGIIKQFLLMHSKNQRGQNISSIFDLFGGAQGSKGHLDDASLRINDIYYIPYKRFGGLDNKTDQECRNDEFSSNCRYIIPSCLTYTKQALLLPLPSSTIGVCYTRGYKKIEDGNYDDRSKYPINTIIPADELMHRKNDLLIPAFKKLFCLLSQIFTLQRQESYVYIVGPSEVTINYNIQDNSYVKCPVTLPTNIFIDENIQEALDNIKGYLSEEVVEGPRNYIGRLKLKDSQNNYFFYGREVDMSNTLYNDILSQYINAYDETIVIDNSSGYSVNDIYYLDSKKIYNKYNDTQDPTQYFNDFDYTIAHNRIRDKENYPMDNDNGITVIDSEYNKLWTDYDIYYNPGYNCYQYNLSKSNFLSLLTKSTLGSKNYILDWAGNCWVIPSFINSFMTVEEAKNTPGSQIDSYSNNFIVLRTLNTVSSTWVEGTDKPGPAFAKIDLGFRGNQKGYQCESGSEYFFGTITAKIQNIINLYNHNYVAITGRYPKSENT